MGTEFAMKIMTFHLSDGAYAVELSAVVEVVRAPGNAAGGEPSPVNPGVPLVDLAERLGVERVETRNTPALVLRGNGVEAGIRVERLGEVVEVDDRELSDLPRYFVSPVLRAVARVNETLVVLLDSDALLRGTGSGESGGAGDQP